jgi:hypothetical protein
MLLLETRNLGLQGLCHFSQAVLHSCLQALWSNGQSSTVLLGQGGLRGSLGKCSQSFTHQFLELSLCCAGQTFWVSSWGCQLYSWAGDQWWKKKKVIRFRWAPLGEKGRFKVKRIKELVSKFLGSFIIQILEVMIVQLQKIKHYSRLAVYQALC